MHTKKLLLLLFAALTGYISYTNAIECYSCDSAQDQECATKPGQQIDVEECSSADDECATAIVGGYTRRGCLSRLFPSKYCNPESCEHCKTSLCNSNIYPANRLRCYQCLSCRDISNSTEKLLPCPIYKADDRCYTNINTFNSVSRGCVSTDKATTCDNICLKCNYNGCNNEAGTMQSSCISCTHMPSRPNAACLRNLQTISNLNSVCHLNTSSSDIKRCTNTVVYGSKAQCFTHINTNTGVVERGCATKMPTYSNGQITLCYGDDCNTNCASIGCNICSSNGSSLTSAEIYNCRQGVNLQYQNCDSNVYDCYSCEMGNSLRRGCADANFRSLTNARESSADLEEVCYRCRDLDGCNKTPVRTCYRCSSLDESECSLLDDVTDINQELCSSTDELCISTLVQKLDLKYVLRGCATTVPECTENDAFCMRCNASLCNRASIALRINDRSNNNNNLNSRLSLLLTSNDNINNGCLELKSFSFVLILLLLLLNLYI